MATKSGKRPCVIANCDKMCSEKSRFDICELCRGNICTAVRKGPKWVLQRKSNLERYTDRMAHLGYRRER
jgi:hypothetical protein